jgi:hypothetical protein
VKENPKGHGNPYKSIMVIDDGSGMDLETFKEALRLGSETGKNSDEDQGCYGVGLKAASLSLGKRLDIFTKSENDKFYHAKIDIDLIEKEGLNSIGFCEGNDEQFQFFKNKTEKNTGTIVMITNIDRVKNSTLKQFTNILKRELGTTYYYFIKEYKKKIFVNGDEVTWIDPMYRDKDFMECLSSNETFSSHDLDFTFNVFHMKNINGVTNELEYRRNNDNSGIWIFRNYRLVGRGLDLQVIKKAGDGYGHGVRIELHISGDSDYLFGSTTTKIITERTKDFMDQSFHDLLSDKLQPYVNQIRRLYIKKKSNEVTAEDKKELDAIFDRFNKNKFIHLEKWGENQKHDTCDKCKKLKEECSCEKKPKPQPDPNREIKTRKRNEKNFKWDVKPNGEFGKFIEFEKLNGRFLIVYNSDHSLWKSMNSQTNDAKSLITGMLLSLATGFEKTGYYRFDSDETIRMVLDKFLDNMSEELRTLLEFTP